jgi:hypothetical protein
MLSERITERTACAETHAIELLDHLTFPGSTAYDQKPCEEPMTRRTVLKAAGRGMEAAALSLAAAGALAQNTAGKVSLSLIVDDGSPVDPLFYEIPGYETPFLVPAEFTARVAETFERFDLRGKLTIIPMPSCLGRIDQSLKRVPPDHLQAFLKIVRERIAPRFDITPEFLTHLRAYDLKKGGYQHIFEDAWITRAPLEEVVEYFTLAFQILQNVGLPATGITSPWDSGIDVEKKYAQALADAQWKVFQRKLTWYFLYSVGSGPPRKLSVEYQAPERGQTVVSVPANFPDIFWSMERPVAERRQFIQNNIDHLLSADGRTGRIRELIESNHPVILLTHWQSLYTQGTGLGLEGLTALAERIQKVFGNNVEWISCSERARRFVNG